MQFMNMILGAALSCQPTVNNDFLGFWESSEVMGIGTALEFNADGSVLSTVTVIVNLFYRYQDGKLAIASSPSVVQELPGHSIEFQGRFLIDRRADGSTVRKEWIDPMIAGVDPIVGVWRYEDHEGGIAFDRFTADGRLLFRKPIGSWYGCYFLKDNHTAIVVANKPNVEHTYRLHDGKLQFEGGGAKDQSDRIPGGAWYPREAVR